MEMQQVRSAAAPVWGVFVRNRGKYGILERRWRSVPYEVMSL